MPSPALPAVSYAAVVRRSSAWAKPAARPRKPSLKLPEDVLYDVLEHLSTMLVFEEARNALLACALVSRSFRRLAKRHKDEHLVLHFWLRTQENGGRSYHVGPRSLARISSIRESGHAERVRSLEVKRSAEERHLNCVVALSLDSPPSTLRTLSLTTPSAACDFAPLLPLFGDALTSLSLAFPFHVFTPSEYRAKKAFTVAPFAQLRYLTLRLALETPCSEISTATRSTTPSSVFDHALAFFATSGTDLSLSSFRLTLNPDTSSVAVQLKAGLAAYPGVLQKLAAVKRVKAVDATALDAGWAW